MSIRIIREMIAVAETLEARADGSLPLDAYDMAALAIRVRAWMAAIAPAPWNVAAQGAPLPDNVVKLHARRAPAAGSPPPSGDCA